MRIFTASWHLVALVLLRQFDPNSTSQVHAQFIQGCEAIPSRSGGVEYYYTPTLGAPPKRCIALEPTTVFLEYNCFYMRDICKNAENFFASTRGLAHFSQRTYFGYDFNTGRKGRSTKRREKACPTGKNGWITGHKCPENDQQEIWRNDGPWRYKDLEPTSTDGKTIRHERDAKGNVKRLSKIRYSCDEFPPATWVEGGNGAGILGNIPWAGDSETRCAAIRCSKGVKAEQNWQGAAHGRLRQLLKQTIDEANQASPPPYPYFDAKDSIVFFNFRMANDPNTGIAAKIYTYTGPPPQGALQGLIGIPQAKRSLEQERFNDWSSTVSMPELVKMGNVSQHYIFTNETEFVDPGVPRSINHNPLPSLATDDIDENEGEDILDDDETILEEDQQVSKQEKNPLQTADSGKDKNYGNGLVTSLLTSFRKRLALNSTLPMTNSTSTSDLDRARRIVKAAMQKSIRLNQARLANPRRNQYGAKANHRSGHAKQTRAFLAQGDNNPLLALTDEIIDAAALVSEADAIHFDGNLTTRDAVTGSYWMGQIRRQGTVPWGDDPNYKVFRNVREFGAVGDGKTDDTKAIKRAMNDGRRCGEKCNGSTTKNAIVYFPPGRYRVSSTIPLPFGTQVIGDAGNWPTIVAAPSFIGLGVLSTDEYTGNGTGSDGGDQQWFVNTANFYRQIRNLKIDITATVSDQKAACIHYQVAQATSIQNVELIAAPGSNQQGIFAENGSGGVISDILFRGGKFGIYGGNQQFTAQRLQFDGCTTGVQVIWDWGWIWKSITMKNVNVGFRLLQESTSGNIGSVSVIDSSFQNVDTAILMAPINSKTGSGSTGVIVENVDLQNVAKVVADTKGAVLLAPSSKIVHWAVGPVYSAQGTRDFSSGRSVQSGFHRQSALLDSKGSYFERAKPQYESSSLGDFTSIKDFGARGDGVSDDTVAFQGALYASRGKILFVDAGSYILTKTIIIPTGTRIVGETWSQLVASGSYFEDASRPKVMIQVGNEGDEGDVEMQDLIFTNRGPTAGLILVEWNVKAAQPGSAALWDCHVRIGGAVGTGLTPKECPPSTSGINAGCSAASLMMHITPKASGYFENMWLWVADHLIDDPDLEDANNPMIQTSIYVARGLLIESQAPVWLYGTSSEHSVYYQYNFNNARNIFAGMIQTESPYYQPTPPPPAPFEKQVGTLPGDPSYKCSGNNELSGCDESWAVIMRGSSNIFIAGAGLYSWFSTYAQDCIGGQKCQNALILLQDNEYNIRFQHLITIGAKYMAVHNGKGIPALDNLNVETHPRWSQISVFDVLTKNSGSANDIWIDPTIWNMKNPQFTCTLPCTVVLPPWTAATSVVDYPMVTVSSGAWTSTITKPPMTVTEWVFQKLTIEAKGLQAREAADSRVTMMPTLEPSKRWAGISYLGPDDLYTTITPTATSPPSLPTTFKTDGPRPPTGIWPTSSMTIILKDNEKGPFVDECSFLNQQDYCDLNKDVWTMLENLLFPWGRDTFYDESGPEDRGPCLPVPEPSTNTPVQPTSPALAHASPLANHVACRERGEGIKHIEGERGYGSFCHRRNTGDLLKPGDIVEYTEILRKPQTIPGRLVAVDRGGLFGKLSVGVNYGCEWSWNVDECTKYFRAILDGCNCGGVDGKQGGAVGNNCLNFRLGISLSESQAARVHDEL